MNDLREACPERRAVRSSFGRSPADALRGFSAGWRGCLRGNTDSLGSDRLPGLVLLVRRLILNLHITLDFWSRPGWHQQCKALWLSIAAEHVTLKHNGFVFFVILSLMVL